MQRQGSWWAPVPTAGSTHPQGEEGGAKNPAADEGRNNSTARVFFKTGDDI